MEAALSLAGELDEVIQFTALTLGRLAMPDFFQKPTGIASLVGSAVLGPYLFFSVQSPPNAASRQIPQPPPSLANFSSGMQDLSNNAMGYLTSYTSNGGGSAPTTSSMGFNSNPSDAAMQNSGLQPGGMAMGGGLPQEQHAYSMHGLPNTNSYQPQIVAAPITDFREVLRFDVTPAWVPQRFPQVTTVLADLQLDGLRVPFVSGTNPTDVAGTLSYYFDRAQSLRRIQLHATTGDPSLLVALLTQFYGLQQEQSLGGYLYTAKWNNRVTSMLKINPAAMLYSHDTTGRFQLMLELNQPSLEYSLSNEAESILQQSVQTGRW